MQRYAPASTWQQREKVLHQKRRPDCVDGKRTRYRSEPRRQGTANSATGSEHDGNAACRVRIKRRL